VEGGDSSGISGTGETPQIAKRPRRLTANPRGKRPPETEIINIYESIFLFKTPETLDLWN
jgi:hypothetical protein